MCVCLAVWDQQRNGEPFLALVPFFLFPFVSGVVGCAILRPAAPDQLTRFVSYTHTHIHFLCNYNRHGYWVVVASSGRVRKKKNKVEKKKKQKKQASPAKENIHLATGTSPAPARPLTGWRPACLNGSCYSPDWQLSLPCTCAGGNESEGESD